MTLPIIKVPKGHKIAVVGDIHEHDLQFYDLLGQLNPGTNLIFVSVGDIYDKGFGISKAEKIVRTFQELHALGYGYVVRGNHELKNIKNKRYAGLSQELAWLDRQPLSLSFEFINSSRVTVVHGGVSPAMTWDDLSNNIEICYIRNLDQNGHPIRLQWDGKNKDRRLVEAKRGGKSWHSFYDGRFGYIASGHDSQKDGIAKFYNYSCNLDTSCYDTGILTAQIFSEYGREDLVIARGQSKKSLNTDGKLNSCGEKVETSRLVELDKSSEDE